MSRIRGGVTKDGYDKILVDDVSESPTAQSLDALQAVNCIGTERTTKRFHRSHDQQERGRTRHHRFVISRRLQGTAPRPVRLDEHEVGQRGQGVDALGGDALHLVRSHAPPEERCESFLAESALEGGA